MHLLRPYSTLHTLVQALRLYRPHLRSVGALVALAIMACALTNGQYLVMQRLIDGMLHAVSWQRTIKYCALLFFVLVAGYAAVAGQRALNARIGQSIIRELRNRLYRRIQAMPFSFFTRVPSGEVLSVFNSDVSDLQTFTCSTVVDAFSSFINFGSILIAMCYISPLLTLISVSILPAFIINHLLTDRKRRTAIKERQRAVAGFARFLTESLSIGGILFARHFGRMGDARQKVDTHSQQVFAAEVKQHAIGATGSLLFGVFMALASTGGFLIAGWQLSTGESVFGRQITMGGLVAFTALQGRFYGPAMQLFTLQSRFQAAIPIFNRLFQLLDIPTDSLLTEEKKEPLPPFKGHIAFRDVRFRYPDAEEAVKACFALHGTRGESRITVDGITFEVPAGKTVALVGPSGSGKTTIAYLLTRVFSPDSGTIELDGVPVGRIPPAQFSELVGVISQEPFLMHASVQENIACGTTGATMADIIVAAKAAAIHDRVLRMPHGYDTIVGERGYMLSGGEKQRVAIARVFLKNPKILILDEATSALDAVSEGLIQESLARITQHRTTIVIAHRLSTVVSADSVLLVQNGRIVASGTHEELTRENDFYRTHFRLGSLSATAF